MITIRSNNETCEIQDKLSLKDYLDRQLASNELVEPFAVALNGEFVSRSNYAQTILVEGDTLDIVAPVGGG